MRKKPRLFWAILRFPTIAKVVIAMLFIQAGLAAAVYTLPTVSRAKVDISENSWKFDSSNTLMAQAVNYNDASWTTVTLPHTWNTKANRNTFTNCWYRTHFTGQDSDTTGGKRLYLFFGAAMENADVYLNGSLIGHHAGGFNAFIFDGTAKRVNGDNVIAVRVNSTDRIGLPSAGNKWEHHGGLIRKAFILKTGPYAIDPTDYASTGVYIQQSEVSGASATVTIKTMLRNTGTVDKLFTVNNIVCDSSNNIIITLQGSKTVKANTHDSITINADIGNPTLWTMGAPYLYKVNTELTIDGTVVDLVIERTGFRFYKLEATSFTINGVQKLLRGACMHAEFNYTKAIDSITIAHQFDVIQDLGMNYTRLVHYPHSVFAYNIADERGIAVSSETGMCGGNTAYVSASTDTNCRELIKQNFNHPSILWWGAANEDGYSNGANATRCAGVLKPLDSTRPIVYASSGQKPSGMDYIFQNIYPGWYSGTLQSFPMNNHWISETGIGGVVSAHQSYRTTTFDVAHFEPEEYAELGCEYKFQYIFKTNPTFVPLYAHWVLYDDADGKYKGLNSKGLITAAGLPKDHYFLWKALARPSVPVVWITGKRWYMRTTDRDVKVYSNRSSISLFVNGKAKGNKADGGYKQPTDIGGSVINNVFYFDTVLFKGKNIVIASDGLGNADTAIIYSTGSGAAALADSMPAVTNLVSGNQTNPAFFINMPVHSYWPIYYQCDGNADNAFDTIPSILSGAGWIATKRQSVTSATASLSFTINPALKSSADVFVMCTQQANVPSWITSSGFTNTGVTGNWIDNYMNPVGYMLFKKTCAVGSKVTLSGSTIDFVVLVKTASTSGIVPTVGAAAVYQAGMFRTFGNRVIVPAMYGSGKKEVVVYSLLGKKIFSKIITGRSFETSVWGQSYIVKVKPVSDAPALP